VLRLALTVSVAQLADAEHESSHTPSFARDSIRPDGQKTGFRNAYGWLILPHKIVMYLFYLSLVLAVSTFAVYLTATVWLPGT
jgi:hypothetical protein